MEPTIRGGCLLSFRLAVCYCPRSCSVLGAILRSSNVVCNSVLATKLSLTGRSSSARQCRASFWVVHYSFLYGDCWGERGKSVETDEGCFSRPKCNCGRLQAATWVFVGVERESRTPVSHLLLITLLRHCSPSLRGPHTRTVLPSVLTAQLITAQLDQECVEHSVGLCS